MLLSLLQEFLVEEENEKVHIDLGLVEEFHDSHTLVLKLQEVLVEGEGKGRGLRLLHCGPASL